MKNIAVLGSTGSIGRNTLEIVSELNDRFNIVGLAAGRNLNVLQTQIERFSPRIVSVEQKSHAKILKKKNSECPLSVVYGQEGAESVASFEDNDIVVSAITGINGLRATLSAVRAGKRVALANKESMVVAGPLIRKAARESGVEILPVDSEHSGVFQCLAKENLQEVNQVILTASGGPFFRSSLKDMENTTLEEALDHPRWKMGEKVTIDSATLMNKGLELIEARWLFDLAPEQLNILIHPQSIVHSLVEMNDGSILAQLSPTDMKIPIQYALTYPERASAPVPRLCLSEVKTLEFHDVDTDKYPLVLSARRALQEGGSLAVVLNAANEVAVKLFLQGRRKLSDIPKIVAGVMDDHVSRDVSDLEDILDVDRETRRKTQELVKKRY